MTSLTKINQIYKRELVDLVRDTELQNQQLRKALKQIYLLSKYSVGKFSLTKDDTLKEIMKVVEECIFFSFLDQQKNDSHTINK